MVRDGNHRDQLRDAARALLDQREALACDEWLDEISGLAESRTQQHESLAVMLGLAVEAWTSTTLRRRHPRPWRLSRVPER